MPAKFLLFTEYAMQCIGTVEQPGQMLLFYG